MALLLGGLELRHRVGQYRCDGLCYCWQGAGSTDSTGGCRRDLSDIGWLCLLNANTPVDDYFMKPKLLFPFALVAVLVVLFWHHYSGQTDTTRSAPLPTPTTPQLTGEPLALDGFVYLDLSLIHI